ncbi:unnamed protein product [Rotaria sordida]|uniref:Uncharacterized protein n=1 Tax=Rotaria sordida TaxID=392033 RepID=A0A815HGJ6_9BILA|nr:unnamed protein product [Rotaria sordida]CAF1602507.1 unnamed protein product [Rotaria sordida]
MDIAIMNETEEAALDLGGGSTQITYNPSLSNTSLAEKINLLLKAQQPIEPEQINTFRDPLLKKKETNVKN